MRSSLHEAWRRCFDGYMETREAVSRSLSTRALQELAEDDFAQIDIDQLFEEPPMDPVRVGLQCLRLALEEARATHPDVDGVLTVPLATSDTLDTEAPTLATYVETLDLRTGDRGRAVTYLPKTSSRPGTRPTTGRGGRISTQPQVGSSPAPSTSARLDWNACTCR